MLGIRRLDPDVLLRVAADAVLVNAALVVAFAARVLFMLWSREDRPDGLSLAARHVLHASVRDYAASASVLTVLCLAAFAAFGFYTYGRAYESKWKALIIVQAVTVAYLAFGASCYLLTKITIWFPRSVWIAGWGLTVGLVGAARLWGRIWHLLAHTEWRLVRTTRQRAVRNVVVIGGAGYIGSILVRKLLDRGYYVTVLDALVYGDEGIRALAGAHRFELIRDDFRNIEGVVRAMQGADAVVHLGAVVGDPACALDERLTLEINLAATRMIAEAARGFGIQRFIFASTCSVYGASDQTLDERSVLKPVSVYAQSKVDAEQALLELDDAGFAPTVMRFATIYGLSPRPRFDLVVNVLAARATRDKRITIFGGDQWRPFVHVDDVASALLTCLESPLKTVKGQIYNVGSDKQNYRITDLGKLIKELIPDTEIELRGEDVDRRNYRVSFAKIRKQLGYQPVHTVVDGVLEIQSALLDGRIGDFQDARYSNYKSLADTAILEFVRRSRVTSLYMGAESAGSRSGPAVGLLGAES